MSRSLRSGPVDAMTRMWDSARRKKSPKGRSKKMKKGLAPLPDWCRVRVLFFAIRERAGREKWRKQKILKKSVDYGPGSANVILLLAGSNRGQKNLKFLLTAAAGRVGWPRKKLRSERPR
jgi:hypothetical protein